MTPYEVKSLSLDYTMPRSTNQEKFTEPSESKEDLRERSFASLDPGSKRPLGYFASVV
jgi:hypothetical protein